MTEKKKREESASTKSDLLKVAGYTAAALAVPFVARTIADHASPVTLLDAYDADVLVIGGGGAGIFAALRARAEGLNVTLVDKGSVGCSGLSPWAGGISMFDPAHSNRATWQDAIAHLGEHLNDKRWLDLYMDQSKKFYDYLAGLGILKSNIVERGKIWRNLVVHKGVTLVERVMVTSLLQGKDKRVAGAVGFSYDDSINESKAIVFTAKCVVLCTGPATFKAPGFPAWGQTGDGDALAYSVGASISGKEFSDTHMTFAKHPADVWGGWGVSEGKFIGGAGHAGRRNPFMLDLSRFFQAADGVTDTIGTGGPPGSYGSPGGPLDPRAARPVGMEPPDEPGGPGGHGGEAPPDWKMDFNILGTRMVGGATNGMAPHKAEGVFCSDYTGAAEGVTGLYAAGDALSSMLLGTTYSMGGTAYLGSCQQGDHVAGFAASYIKANPPPLVSRDSIERSVAAVWTARERKQGYTPQWVSRVLRNTMMPYYVLYVKSPDRMQAALSVIQYLRGHCVPSLIAASGHDLREAHEVSNMLLNAEMKLQAGLFRTESRGTHYREDYPARNDAQWLAWIKIRDNNGKMELTKHPIPEEWRPDSAIPYRARYPTEFPGEDVFRKKSGIS